MRVAPLVALVLLTCPAAVAAVGPLDLEPGDLSSGLVGEYRSVAEPGAFVTRVDAKPAFYLGRSSPHPRIPPGPFEVTWSGVLSLKERGSVTFSAFVGGELTVTIDGVVVLDGRGITDTARVNGKAPLKRDPGFYTFTVKYRSLADVPARLQLWWEGEAFAREPIPAWRFGHLDADRTDRSRIDGVAALGRVTVGQYGCARCHAGAFPAVKDPPPGPSLADAGRRLSKPWLMNWLAVPHKVRPDAHMPGLFTDDRTGFVERWMITEHLTAGAGKRAADPPTGDHRRGRITFLSVGCATCHVVPDIDRNEQPAHGQTPFVHLGDRLTAGDLAAFLGNPHGRYPDGRMPRLPLTPVEARDIAAYLLLWSKPTEPPAVEAPKAEEIQAVVKKLGARNEAVAVATLISERRCTACHTGLGPLTPRNIPIKDRNGGCLHGGTGVNYGSQWPGADEMRITMYLTIAAKEKYPSPFADRQHRLAQLGCAKCHQRDTDRPPAIESIGSTFGGSNLQELPYLRTPRLTNPHQKFTRTHLASAVREGVSGLRWSRFSYRMPAFGPEADALVLALAEADGELPTEPDSPLVEPADPTLGTVHGPQLVGFQGYACASCHVWNGKLLAAPDPGATGPDLTRTAGRIRRDWFDRYLESPMRFHPGTPMPAVFEHGKPAALGNVLGGDPAKQTDAIWAYLARGKDAPSPAPPPPLPITPPAPGEPILVAQIPIRFPDGKVIESVCLLTADNDLVVYDLADGVPHTLFTGGQILRNVQGRIRQFLASGTATDLAALRLPEKVKLTERTLLGYDRLADGVRVRWRLRFDTDSVEVADTLRFGATRLLTRELGPARASFDLPAAKPAPPWEVKSPPPADDIEGSLERPGYKAIVYPRPKTVSGEDRVMPGAVAVRPKDGQVFVASLKTGELFALRDPTGDGKNARFDNYARGLYQDGLSMLADDEALYVLHRRNLTKITGDKTGTAERFDRVAALPHGVADTYDMAYGLARDREGRFVFGYAPYANQKMPGSGGALRLTPGKPPEEIGYGMRNAIGWCRGPDGEIFFTDNQGEWVATNKLGHVAEGKFQGFPNPAQKQHATKPHAPPVVWVPYSWARSINGVAFDDTGGKFGPFAGQVFMAELMFGGAVIRANVEKVNGVYQGACFPFWGKGLLGPVTLAFDPRGKLYVGGITEPGWMARPDRGALFRIDFTGEVPFEMKSMHARPRGFRVEFTKPVDRDAAGLDNVFRLESYRYEYTGAYGSPELDRATVKVEKVEVSADGRIVELTTAPLVKGRVYLLTLSPTLRSADKKPPVHAVGAYTLNEIPAK